MTDVTHRSRPTASELMELSVVADDRIGRFFSEALRLTPAQLQLLARSSGTPALTALSLEVDRGFLDAVASGAWTSTHRCLSTQLHETARVTAAALAPWGRRRRLAHVLACAAMVVLVDADAACPLPDSLTTRLASPWVSAMGSWPGQAMSTSQ